MTTTGTFTVPTKVNTHTHPRPDKSQRLLTGHERHLAEQDPFQRKVQVDLHIPSDAVVQFDGHLPCMLHVRVAHVIEAHWLRIVLLATDAEVHQRPVEYLRVGGWMVNWGR